MKKKSASNWAWFLMTNFDRVPVGQVARSVSDTHAQRDGQLIFLNTSDIDRGRILHHRYSSVATMPGQAKKSVSTGDILFSEIRPANGRWALVTEPADDLIVSTKLMVIRPIDDDRLDPPFLYLFLTAPSTTAWLQVLAESRSGTFPQITFDQVSTLEMPLPSLREQRGIAATLGALDDKLESNLRIVEMIPQLIRAQVTASLNSSSSEVAVADLAEFVNGGAYTKGASGTGRMVIRIAELNSGPGSSTVYNDIEVPEDKVARAGDMLMSWSGSLGVYRWVLGEAIVNQHIFKVLPVDSYPAWLVFDRLDAVMPVFRGIAKDKATTMGHIQRGHLSSTVIDVPGPELVGHLHNHVAPLWDRLLVAEQENLLLAALRNTLLPELLSGRIRVPEAQEAVAGVGA
ncbi:MAG: restriction endonuclease subunit S [Candidatus Nanopelagicales bacterium]